MKDELGKMWRRKKPDKEVGQMAGSLSSLSLHVPPGFGLGWGFHLVWLPLSISHPSLLLPTGCHCRTN